jgi:hypothetical protein
VDIASLHLTVTVLREGIGRARIDGRVRLRHSFYPGKPSEDYADAKLLGYMDFDANQSAIERLRLVTSDATYITNSYGTSVVSVSPDVLSQLAH